MRQVAYHLQQAVTDDLLRTLLLTWLAADDNAPPWPHLPHADQPALLGAPPGPPTFSLTLPVEPLGFAPKDSTPGEATVVG